MQPKRFLLIALTLLVLAGTANAATFVESHGITWTFNGDYETGQFANGDWWVVGPVQITGISPGRQEISQDGQIWTINGSMINPDNMQIGGGEHGYDSRVTGFNPELSAAAPLTLNPNESLISSISWQFGEPGCPDRSTTDPSRWTYYAPRPSLRSQAILTALDSVPPENSFRPAYVGTEKTIFEANLNTDTLPDLSIDSMQNVPMPEALTWLERPWTDHVTGWWGRYLHPSENMPDTGRRMAGRINPVSLLVLSNISETDKQKLTIQLTQLGIDLHGIVKNGGGWGTVGGMIGVGRKWPILFAGLMLDNAEMKAIGTNYDARYFQEDGQTFYITEEDQDRFPPTTRSNCRIEATDPRTIIDGDGGSWWDNDQGGTQPFLSERGFPGDFRVRVDYGNRYEYSRGESVSNQELEVRHDLSEGTGLTAEIQLFPGYLLGHPAWGERHVSRPENDFYSRMYRTEASCNFDGPALSALILDAKELWNHEAFFDYTDYYMDEKPVGSSDRSWSRFAENMWDRHRKDYGCIFTGVSNGERQYDCSQCIYNCPEEHILECIDTTALIGHILEWKQGSLAMADIMQKLEQWKAGTGCP